ncbi:hypothetical protein EV209_2845 [Cuneatibacter caecimuris]|uniref:Uncharacterized protein n=1 Tax=Cuneatibacter caecimuris TaxID=1796618 RepID=A0A4Q7NZ84_9FIRM|nr:hypothetical protein EV209_2845 [Cuneatibacter caecimuris]
MSTAGIRAGQQQAGKGTLPKCRFLLQGRRWAAAEYAADCHSCGALSLECKSDFMTMVSFPRLIMVIFCCVRKYAAEAAPCQIRLHTKDIS